MQKRENYICNTLNIDDDDISENTFLHYKDDYIIKCNEKIINTIKIPYYRSVRYLCNMCDYYEANAPEFRVEECNKCIYNYYENITK